MTYTVYYKYKNSFFWKKLKKVKADGIYTNKEETFTSKRIPFKKKELFFPYRWFILEDETRIEIPMDSIIFKFDSSRFLVHKQNLEVQTGQVLPLVK